MRGKGVPLEVERLEISGPGPDEIRVRLAASGVCHSDLHVYEAGAPNMHLPLVLGHEGAGEVIGVGADVDEFGVGDHVVLCTVPQCGRCTYCRSGMPTLCVTYPKTVAGTLPDGSMPLSLGGNPVGQMAGLGCWSEEAVVHRLSAVKIDGAMPFASAALLGCGVVTGFGAVANVAHVQPGDSMTVIGCGGLGLSAVQAGRIAGAEQIIAVDVNQRKLEMARTFGATDVVDAASGDQVQHVRELTGGLGTTFAFDFVGTAQSARAALATARRGGTLVMTGLGSPELAFDVNDLIRAGRTIKGNLMGMGDFRAGYARLVALYQGGLLQLDELVSQRLDLDQVQMAFDAMAEGDVARSVFITA
jgi:S-(hydroxymethyl)glutathione dehydrogenase / alcohol dehydrogenase